MTFFAIRLKTRKVDIRSAGKSVSTLSLSCFNIYFIGNEKNWLFSQQKAQIQLTDTLPLPFSFKITIGKIKGETGLFVCFFLLLIACPIAPFIHIFMIYKNLAQPHFSNLNGSLVKLRVRAALISVKSHIFSVRSAWLGNRIKVI